MSADTNERGNRVYNTFHFGRDRYVYDFNLCRLADGWQQYDTDQDASYFGVWVHQRAREVLAFADGNESLTRCPTAESFNAELAAMAEFYGSSPTD